MSDLLLLAAILSIHGHARFPGGDFPTGFQPLPLNIAAAIIQLASHGDHPFGGSNARRSISRLASTGLALPHFRVAIEILGGDADDIEQAIQAVTTVTPIAVDEPAEVETFVADLYRKGRWAMTVNERWRITFRFADGDAHDVTIEDYNRG